MTKKEKKNIFTPERTFKYFILNFVAVAIAGIIIWPLLDLLFEAMRGNSFTWTVYGHIISPIVFAFFVTVVEFVCWNFFHKENK